MTATKALEHILTGRSHVRANTLFDGMDWRLAGERLAGERLAGSPYSVWQLLGHMIYWQDFLLAELLGEKPAMPEHAEGSWPKAIAPGDEDEWTQAVSHFKAGLQEAQRQLAEGDLESPLQSRTQSRAETLASIASHNSYHGGQVALLRRMLGTWPPPNGGDTW